MSDPVDLARAPVCRFGPDRRLAVLSAVLTVIACGAAALSNDAPGRLLAILAAVVLAGYAFTDLVFWPRLTASAEGLHIHTPFSRARLSWPEVDEIRVDERTRLGLTSRTLEIDAGPLLVVLSKRALGTDPREAAGLIKAFRPS